MSTAVVVPLKRFDRAKSRLRRNGDLDVTAIVEALARGVIVSARPRPVIIVSEDVELAAFATSLNVELMLSASTTLNEAVQGAYSSLSDRFDQLIIAHGDLRTPDGLGSFEPEPGITSSRITTVRAPTCWSFPRISTSASRTGLDPSLVTSTKLVASASRIALSA